MAFSRPTLQQLVSRARADMEAELQNGGAYLRRSFESAMAKVLAGLAHTLHGHLDFIALQVIPSTSDDEFLIAWAELFLGADARNAATQAVFTITVTGTVNGTAIPTGTRWSRVDGEVFEATGDYVLAGLEASVQVRALVAGAKGNTLANTLLTLTNGIAGINATATVEGTEDALVGGGSDIETISQLKARLISFLQTPPRGGAPGDYVTWALEVDGVTRAWELPLALGPGTVVVLFVQDSFDAEGFYAGTVFPNAFAVSTVTTYLNARIPMTANPSMTSLTGHSDYVFAPIEVQLNPVIALSPNNADTQTQVVRYLQDLMLRQSRPLGTIQLNDINEAISLAPGEVAHSLISPAAPVVATGLQLYTLGNVTFQDL